MRNKLLSGIAIVIALLLLASCAHSPPPNPNLWQFRQDRIHELRVAGVQFIQTGETILVSLPSDNLFYPHSSNFAPHAGAIITPLMRLLATYQTGVMKISAHTDNLCPNEIYIRALTERQARRVADCLVDYGMDARLIYTLGCGASEPIASNINSIGRAANRRVDIQFRFLSGDNE